MEQDNWKFFLEGTWRGSGRVIDTLEYEEELEFTKVKPIVYFYRQKLINPDKELLHSEVGYLRVFREPHAKEGKIELTISHPFGVCEVCEGTFTEKSIMLKSVSVIRTSSALEQYVTKLFREFTLKDQDTIVFNTEMSSKTETKEQCPHLVGELKRVK